MSQVTTAKHHMTVMWPLSGITWQSCDHWAVSHDKHVTLLLHAHVTVMWPLTWLVNWRSWTLAPQNLQRMMLLPWQLCSLFLREFLHLMNKQTQDQCVTGGQLQCASDNNWMLPTQFCWWGVVFSKQAFQHSGNQAFFPLYVILTYYYWVNDIHAWLHCIWGNYSCKEESTYIFLSKTDLYIVALLEP